MPMDSPMGFSHCEKTAVDWDSQGARSAWKNKSSQFEIYEFDEHQLPSGYLT